MAISSFEKLIDSEKPVFIDFYATWCGPCTAFLPTLKEVKAELGDLARIVKIDIDKNQELATKLGVRSVPTLMIYQKGEQKWRTTGGKSKDKVISKLKEFIA